MSLLKRYKFQGVPVQHLGRALQNESCRAGSMRVLESKRRKADLLRYTTPTETKAVVFWQL